VVLRSCVGLRKEKNGKGLGPMRLSLSAPRFTKRDDVCDGVLQSKTIGGTLRSRQLYLRAGNRRSGRLLAIVAAIHRSTSNINTSFGKFAALARATLLGGAVRLGRVELRNSNG
jgi:hypothetical protein